MKALITNQKHASNLLGLMYQVIINRNEEDRKSIAFECEYDSELQRAYTVQKCVDWVIWMASIRGKMNDLEIKFVIDRK